MSDRSSRSKDKSAGKRPPEGGVPPGLPADSLDATVILNPVTAGIAADQRVRIPRSELVEPGGATVQISRQPEPADHAEGTQIMPMAAPREPDTLPGVEAAERTQILQISPPAPAPAAEAATLRLLPEDRERILAGEGTMIMPLAAPAPEEAGTLRLLRGERDAILAGEGTMLLPTMTPAGDSTMRLLPGEREALLAGEGTMIMPVAAIMPVAIPMAEDPDTRPDLVAPATVVAEPMEGTMIMPVAATMPAAAILPDDALPPSAPIAAGDPPTDEDAFASLLTPETDAPLEGTMILPIAVPVPGMSGSQADDTPTKPDIQVPPEIRAAGEGTLILRSAPPTHEAAPEPARVAASMPTAAEVIQERLAASDARLSGYPHAAAEPPAAMRAAPMAAPTLPAELLPPPVPPSITEPERLDEPPSDDSDPESPRATLRVPLKDMPELRQPVPVAAPQPSEARPEPARFADEDPLPPPAPDPYRPAPAPTPAAPAAPARPEAGTEGFSPEGQLGTPPGRSFALVWIGVIAVVVLLIGGLWAVNMGWFGGGVTSGKPVAAPVPAPVPSEGGKLPESMRAAFDKALAGDPNAMRYLGVCYINGLGVPADRSEGLKWYRRAAAAGSSAAQQDLVALEAQGVR